MDPPVAPPGRKSGPARSPGRRRAVFLDRDGTLNPDLHYLSEPERLELLSGVTQGIRWLKAHDFLVICVTNQSGIERGLYSESDVEAIHRRLNQRLATGGASVDAFYYCPHAPERGCSCRKPGSLLFERAREEFSVDFGSSAIVGDRSLDVQVGERLGFLTAFVPERGHERPAEEEVDRSGITPDIRAGSFLGAVARLLARG